MAQPITIDLTYLREADFINKTPPNRMLCRSSPELGAEGVWGWTGCEPENDQMQQTIAVAVSHRPPAGRRNRCAERGRRRGRRDEGGTKAEGRREARLNCTAVRKAKSHSSRPANEHASAVESTAPPLLRRFTTPRSGSSNARGSTPASRANRRRHGSLLSPRAPADDGTSDAATPDASRRHFARRARGACLKSAALRSSFQAAKGRLLFAL
jgi:hypothetical protein